MLKEVLKAVWLTMDPFTYFEMHLYDLWQKKKEIKPEYAPWHIEKTHNLPPFLTTLPSPSTNFCTVPDFNKINDVIYITHLMFFLVYVPPSWAVNSFLFSWTRREELYRKLITSSVAIVINARLFQTKRLNILKL